MSNEVLMLVVVAVLEAREKPSTYSSRRPGRHVATMVDQVVSFTIATDDMCLPGRAGPAHRPDRLALQILPNQQRIITMRAVAVSAVAVAAAAGSAA
jgi:hypothetical protein